jgi:hypothetical protein
MVLSSLFIYFNILDLKKIISWSSTLRNISGRYMYFISLPITIFEFLPASITCSSLMFFFTRVYILQIEWINVYNCFFSLFVDTFIFSCSIDIILQNNIIYNTKTTLRYMYILLRVSQRSVGDFVSIVECIHRLQRNIPGVCCVASRVSVPKREKQGRDMYMLSLLLKYDI